ncbi:sugar phosphate nucleotidyltransferase [Haloimpatiens sp. FM7330]|uniref:sugar phosphate nucleotidyltransferase n=1 Tax=Haloimpatiens sp. FM7330 TaxID=3298610 RepID=UPI003632491B
MKGVILAGGKGTRLYPLTKVTNKHLLPVGREPMIYNPIKQLILCGIKDILIITSKEHIEDLIRLLGSGKQFQCNFHFKVQENTLGIANALSLAESFAEGEPIVVILGDNIMTYSIKKYVEDFKKQEKGAKVLLKEVKNPERYGVAVIDKLKVIQIEEKPINPKSNFAVIGVYMYDNQVFDIIRNITPSKRGEYEITSVNNIYIENGQLTYDILEGEWMDAGTFESLKYANDMLFKSNNEIQY